MRTFKGTQDDESIELKRPNYLFLLMLGYK